MEFEFEIFDCASTPIRSVGAAHFSIFRAHLRRLPSSLFHIKKRYDA